jgi:hypothetical protein
MSRGRCCSPAPSVRNLHIAMHRHAAQLVHIRLPFIGPHVCLLLDGGDLALSRYSVHVARRLPGVRFRGRAENND